MQFKQPSPYSGFKDDTQRRIALRNRDIRIAVCAVFASVTPVLPYVFSVLSKLMH